jgi:hypothetical protein
VNRETRDALRGSCSGLAALAHLLHAVHEGDTILNEEPIGDPRTMIGLSDGDAKNRFQHRGDRAMSVRDGGDTKPLPEKEISLEY